MKTLQYKIITIIALLFVTVIAAQKQVKKSTEKFSVNKNVVIDVNTRYTDIEIETWNKNEVVIDAYLVIEGEQDQKIIDDYLKKWNFEASGNKNSINISSKSSGLIDIHSFNFDEPNYDIIISESVIDALENINFEMPEMPEIPEIHEMLEMPEIPEFDFDFDEAFDFIEFDFDAYKKDKSYLERWKKDNKDIIGKNAKIKVGKNSISINSNDDNFAYKWNIVTEGQNELAEEIQERLKEAKVRSKEHKKRLEIRMKEHQVEMKERQVEMKERQKEMQSRIKERNEDHKLDLVKRQEARERRTKEMAVHRNEVRDILAKRGKVKIKRIIKIKAPKDAKFNMNVRYGSMSFPK